MPATAPPIAAPASPLLERSLPSLLAWIVLLFMVSRILLLLIGQLTMHTLAPPEFLAQMGSDLAGLFCRFDCGWYVNLVQHGYSAVEAEPGQTNLAFYPLYPLAVRALMAVTGLGPIGAGLWVSNLCFLGALVYLYRYARLLGASDRSALLAVALLCFVPHGLVFSAMYTESLFLLLLIAAMYHLRGGHYLLAGVLAALLSATRATGFLFVLFAVVWLVQVHGWAVLWRWWVRPQVYVPILLAPLGLFVHFFYLQAHFGDAFAMTSTVAHGWGWRSDWPWSNLATHLRYDPTTLFWASGSLVVAGLCLPLLRRRLWAEFALCLGVLLLLWSGQVANSLLRYSIVLFPAWIMLAQWLEQRPLRQAVVFGGMGIFGGWIMVAWTLQRLIAI